MSLSDLLRALQRLGIGVEPVALCLVLGNGSQGNSNTETGLVTGAGGGALDVALSLKEFVDTGAFLAASASATGSSYVTAEIPARSISSEPCTGAAAVLRE